MPETPQSTTVENETTASTHDGVQVDHAPPIDGEALERDFIRAWQAARDVAACNFDRGHDFLIGIDSDGCAFDTMELKHKECFIPQLINHFDLQGVSKYAREVAEFVNLYSKSRGSNRFPALVETFTWLTKRPEVAARGVHVRVPTGLMSWVDVETKLGNPALEAAWLSKRDIDLRQALDWSRAVNESIRKVVRGVPPFPFVRQALDKLSPLADLVVVSANPKEHCAREWMEHDLVRYVRAVCGQETGTKKEILANACNYPPGHTLMIGDALGDYWSALANGALFFPINPGAEEASWQRLCDEGIDRFVSGSFEGAYQEDLLAEFDRRLPSRPPWPVMDGEPVGGENLNTQ